MKIVVDMFLGVRYNKGMKTTLNQALVNAVAMMLSNMQPGTATGMFRATILRPGIANTFSVDEQPIMSTIAAAEYVVRTYAQS